MLEIGLIVKEVGEDEDKEDPEGNKEDPEKEDEIEEKGTSAIITILKQISEKLD